MIVKDIMTKNVKVIPQTATVRDAAKLMKDIDVGAIPVVEDDRIIGIVTDRDIVLRSTAEGRNPNETRLEEVMTKEFFYCFEEDSVKEAAKVMREKQVRRLPVVNRLHELVGILSLGDISVDSGDDKISGQTLEDISRPARPDL